MNKTLNRVLSTIGTISYMVGLIWIFTYVLETKGNLNLLLAYLAPLLLLLVLSAIFDIWKEKEEKEK